MLESLDEIDWSKLRHAYGKASDVPGLIRALISENKDVRYDATYQLFGNICHQGTVYEASCYVVPFLHELLMSAETPDRMMIAGLLAEMANGGSYLEFALTNQRMETLIRDSLAREGRDFDEELVDSRHYADVTREAIGKELPLLYPYLVCEEPEIRLVVATALKNYPERSGETVPILKQSLASETEEEVMEAMEEAIAILKDKVI